MAHCSNEPAVRLNAARRWDAGAFWSPAGAFCILKRAEKYKALATAARQGETDAIPRMDGVGGDFLQRVDPGAGCDECLDGHRSGRRHGQQDCIQQVHAERGVCHRQRRILSLAGWRCFLAADQIRFSECTARSCDRSVGCESRLRRRRELSVPVYEHRWRRDSVGCRDRADRGHGVDADRRQPQRYDPVPELRQPHFLQRRPRRHLAGANAGHQLCRQHFDQAGDRSHRPEHGVCSGNHFVDRRGNIRDPRWRNDLAIARQRRRIPPLANGLCHQRGEFQPDLVDAIRRNMVQQQ